MKSVKNPGETNKIPPRKIKNVSIIATPGGTPSAKLLRILRTDWTPCFLVIKIPKTLVKPTNNNVLITPIIFPTIINKAISMKMIPMVKPNNFFNLEPPFS